MTVQPQACPSLEATANRLTGYKGVQVDQGVKKLGEDLRGRWEQADGQVPEYAKEGFGGSWESVLRSYMGFLGPVIKCLSALWGPTPGWCLVLVYVVSDTGSTSREPGLC